MNDKFFKFLPSKNLLIAFVPLIISFFAGIGATKLWDSLWAFGGAFSLAYGLIVWLIVRAREQGRKIGREEKEIEGLKDIPRRFEEMNRRRSEQI